MALSLIVAYDRNGRIGGADGSFPWSGLIPADMRRFRAVTMGQIVVMGRKTAESLPGPLEGRENLVLTRNKDFAPEGFKVFHSINEVRTYLWGLGWKDSRDAVVIGGAEIYAELLPFIQIMFITIVGGDFDNKKGGVFFPKYNLDEWRVASEQFRPKGNRSPYDLEFLTLIRR